MIEGPKRRSRKNKGEEIIEANDWSSKLVEVHSKSSDLVLYLELRLKLRIVIVEG